MEESVVMIESLSVGRRPYICIVTDEFSPFRPGGIGRVLQTLYDGTRAEDAEFHFLCVGMNDDELKGLRGYLRPGDQADSVDLSSTECFYDFQFHTLLQKADHLWNVGPVCDGVQIAIALARIERDNGRPFDFIEFPDFRGWAYPSGAFRRSKIMFENTKIVVRLHSTLDVIDLHESHHLRYDSKVEVIHACERLALSYADIVVGHIEAVLKFNIDRYLLDTDRQECVVESFPILPITDQHDCSTVQNIVFSSRLQPFKRPELFISGVVYFLSNNAGFKGRVCVVCTGWQTDYVLRCRSLVPREFRSRIEFIENASSIERAGLIAGSIFVMSSAYESLCLAAYEANLAGAKVLLPRDCIGFVGEGSPWSDGVNCLIYEPNAAALASVLERAFSFQPSTLNRIDSGRYWDQFEPGHRHAPMSAGSISLIVVAVGGLDDALRSVERAVSSGLYSEIVIAFCSMSEHRSVDAIIMDSISAECANANVRSHFLKLDTCIGRCDAIYSALHVCESEFVLVCMDDDFVDETFVKAASLALAADDCASAVTCMMAVYPSQSGSVPKDIAVPFGPAGSAVGPECLSDHHCVLYRRRALRHADAARVASDEFDLRMLRQAREVICVPLVGVCRYSWPKIDSDRSTDLVKVYRDAFTTFSRRVWNCGRVEMLPWMVERFQAASPSLGVTALRSGRLAPRGAGLKVVMELHPSADPRARGTEVWVQGITIDGEGVRLTELLPQNNWEAQSDGRVCSKYPSSLFRWRLPYSGFGSLRLRLLKHPWSGAVKFRIGSHVANIDLFSDVDAEVTIDYERVADSLKVDGRDWQGA